MTPVTATIICSVVLFIGGIIMAIIGFFLKQLVEQLKELNKTVNEVKTAVVIQSEKHDSLEQRVDKVEHKLKMA